MFQSAFITPVEQIQKELNEVQEFLELEYRGDDMQVVRQRLEDLNQWMARTGKLKADAEWHYFQNYNSSIMACIKDVAKLSMGTSTLNKYLESCCKDYKVLITWSDRTNRSCVHQIDSLRTLISYSKSERNYV